MPNDQTHTLVICIENLMNHGPRGIQCECGGDKRKMKKIELIMRCVRIMWRKCQTYNVYRCVRRIRKRNEWNWLKLIIRMKVRQGTDERNDDKLKW